jgi:hypothetical protein
MGFVLFEALVMLRLEYDSAFDGSYVAVQGRWNGTDETIVGQDAPFQQGQIGR